MPIPFPSLKPFLSLWPPHTRTHQTLLHWRNLLREPGYRQRDARAKADFQRFLNRHGGKGLAAGTIQPRESSKTALIVSQSYLPFAKVEALMTKAFNLAGFRTVVLGNRRYDFLRYGYLVGNRVVYETTDFELMGDPSWIDQQLPNLRTLSDWLELRYQSVHVGRFVIASTLKTQRVGTLDFGDLATQQALRSRLESSVRYTIGALRLLKQIRPDCVLLMDRGYTGSGEVFDLAMNSGIDLITWHMGHRSNRIMVKRYGPSNEREHPFSPSAESWRQLCTMPWKREYGQQVRDEIFSSYEKQDWFSVVGTQFDKAILPKDRTREELGLSIDRKVAVVFPHILWDGSFFFGTDLFDDYAQWFIETIRAASANPRLQWVIKLHPAHVVKARGGTTNSVSQEGEKPAELVAIERNIPRIPDHVKLVYPDTKLSTYSLLQIADYVLTVRGTVGIEAALLGIPVITGGTGRYDRRGFTFDSSSRQEYLQKLATLETLPSLSPDQIELAERYAYGVFCCRPLSLSSASLEYARDSVATPTLTVHCRTPQEWRSARDLRQLGQWLANGRLEDLLLLPVNEHPA